MTGKPLSLHVEDWASHYPRIRTCWRRSFGLQCLHWRLHGGAVAGAQLLPLRRLQRDALLARQLLPFCLHPAFSFSFRV